MKNKLKSIFALSLFTVLGAFAQSGDVGIGTNSPDASAALDIASTTKGLLIPRMTTTQRDDIDNPAKGLSIFNTTTNQFEFNSGTTTLPIWESSKGIVAPLVIGEDANLDNVVDSSAPHQRIAYNGDGTLKTLNDTQYAFYNNTFYIGKLVDVDGTGTAPVFKGDYSVLSTRTLSIGSSIGRADINLQTFNSEPQSSQFTGYRSRGNSIDKLPILAGDRIVRFSGSALAPSNTNAFGVASMDITASQDFTTTSFPTHISFNTVSIGSTVLNERMRINSEGTVAIGTSSPSASAIVDMSSNTRGFLPPRMTNVQYNAISSPAEGLVVYCTDCTVKGLRVFNGTAWADMMNNPAPVNTVTPEISASPSTFVVGASGVIFTITTGTWTGAPTYTYQWSLNGSAISGATSATYSPATITTGNYSCAVTGTNAVSAVTVSVTFAVATTVPVNSVAPVIANNNGTLTVTSIGTWTGANSGFTYQWNKAGVAISGATTASYQVPTADYGSALTCNVTRINNVGATSATSNSIIVDYLNNSVSTGFTAGYSLRKIGASSANAITVRRSGDNTTQDIGFDAYGKLDTAALLAFVGTDSGFVTKWYDQSGNGRDVVQATAGSQPRIVNAGVLETNNGLPTAVSITGTVMRNTSTFASGTDFSVIAVGSWTNIGSSSFPILGCFHDSSLNGIVGICRNGSNGFGWFSFPTVTYPMHGFTLNNLLIASYVKSSTGKSQWKDGGSILNENNATTQASMSPAGITIFGGYIPNTNLNTKVSEVMLFTSSLSTIDRQLIERNQGAYYGITVQ